MCHDRQWSLLYVLLLLLSAVALAQAQPQAALTEPSRLCPKGNAPNRTLDVTMEVKLVPYTRADGKTMQVRSYNLVDTGGWQYCDGQQRPLQNPQIPGPTFQLRKSAAGKTDGDLFKMTLVNKLPVDASGHANHACNPIRDFSQTVKIQPGQTCNATSFPLLPTQMPACFHGDNVTNFHYHGFHVSPQPHQDFVLLNLYPEGSQGVPKDDYNAVGSYQYALDPLPYTQTEGTHWYHPHKHGSTTIQVLNGMAGAFIVTGPFDDWLNGQFPGGLTDKVIVIQQIAEQNNFFSATSPVAFTSTPADATNPALCPASGGACDCTVPGNFLFATPGQVPTLVNGQINPQLTMRSGEIQRWRLVNSMVQIGGILSVGFGPGFEIKQIARDGVQFSPENYAQQPLLGVALFVPNQEPQLLTNTNLAPGNRSDYLVKAPIVTQRTCYQYAQKTAENPGAALRRRQAAQSQAPTQVTPQLLTVCVEPSATPPMTFPGTWLPMPPFLANLPPQPAPPTTVAFSMLPPGGGGVANPHNTFLIDGVQYCPNCANHTMTLGKVYEWNITNDSTIQHPFHIHANPHQLAEQGFMDGTTPVPVQTYASPLWEDTIALSQLGQCWDIPAGPIWNQDSARQKCPTVCQSKNAKLTWWLGTDKEGNKKDGNWVTTKANEMSVCSCCAQDFDFTKPNNTTPSVQYNGYTKIRQQPTDFTGEFVLHCHILGHEDRGMMQNVQVVCPDTDEKSFGKPRAGQPECVPGNYTAAAPKCPAKYATSEKCPL